VYVERERKETLSLYLFLETVKIAIIRTGPPGSAGNGSNVVVVALTAVGRAAGVRRGPGLLERNHTGL
jgi:hypothetical protein